MSRKNARFIVLRDIQDHAIKGALSLFDLGVYSVIHFQTDFSSGLWFGSAARVHATAPQGAALRDVQRSMEHLEELRFLRSFRKHGQRGNAPYLVHKYEPLTGALKGKRLNAFASEDWRKPVYESCALPDAENDALPDAQADTYSVFSTQNAANTKNQNPAAKPTPPADPRFQPFVDFASGAFEQNHGQKPTWGGKDFKALKDMLASNKGLSDAELQRRFRNYLASTEPFTQKQGHALWYFCDHVDSFLKGPILERSKPHGSYPGKASNVETTLAGYQQLRQGQTH